jgi:hypothetical protein
MSNALADRVGVETARPTSTRMALLVAAIVLGGLGQLATILFGWNGDGLSVEWFTNHQQAWIASTYGNALNALGLFALLVAVCVLVKGRGAAWATVSLVIGSLGTALYAVSAAIPIAFTPVGTQTVVPPDQAARLIEYFHRHDVTEVAVAFPAFLLLTVTQITVTVALIRSRAVPLWVPIVFIAFGALAIVFAASGVLTAVLTVPQIVAMVAIGWYAYRTA